GTAYRLSDGGGALPYGSGAETDLIFWDDRPAVSFLRLHRIGECDTDSDLGLIRSCLANPDMAAKWEPLDSGSNQILVGTGDPGALGLENTLVGYIDPATQQHRLLVAYFQQDTACDTTFTFRRSTAWW
ncbi:MAG TPA: hypothetical protein VEI97_10065, partial [bacterium]|nr:hypothetical protein [bacterium]